MTLSIPELRALVAAATPGPWAYEDDGTIGGIFVRPPAGRPHRHDSAADAAFIAAARTAVPALLDRVEALEAGLREALEIANRHVPRSRYDNLHHNHASSDTVRLAELAKLVEVKS